MAGLIDKTGFDGCAPDVESEVVHRISWTIAYGDYHDFPSDRQRRPRDRDCNGAGTEFSVHRSQRDGRRHRSAVSRPHRTAFANQEGSPGLSTRWCARRSQKSPRRTTSSILGSGGAVSVCASCGRRFMSRLSRRCHTESRASCGWQRRSAGAEKIIEERDHEKETFIRTLYGKDWRDPAHYDLVLNIDHFSNEMAVEIIVKAAQAKGIEATAVELPRAIARGDSDDQAGRRADGGTRRPC